MVKQVFTQLLVQAVAGVALLTPSSAADLTYDIIAVKAPRYGDETPTTWQEVDAPAAVEPGQDLVLIRKDGTEESLVECKKAGCAVVDPVISLDGRSVYYSLYPDARPEAVNYQRAVQVGGADIYRMDLATRQAVRLTAQEFTPNTYIPWASDPLNSRNEKGVFKLGYGVLNLGSCPIPGPIPGTERIVFSSSRNGFLPARGLTFPNLQLFVMDANGDNVQQIGHMNLGSALHPTVLMDGRVMFASSEGQGVRDERNWGLWSMYPDGRQFNTLMSAFVPAGSLHFQTQLGNGDIAVTEYYNLNNNGFGTILAFSGAPASSGIRFGDADPQHASNPQVRRGYWYDPGRNLVGEKRYSRYSFSPRGLRNLTAFAHGEDFAADQLADGSFAGKVTHPSAAPDNDLLLIYSPGPANDLARPTTIPRVHGGIYLLRNSAPVEQPSELIKVRVDPNANYQQPRAVVPYKAIYGIDAPAYVPTLPEATSPYGIVGTSSFYNRNSKPGIGVARFSGLDPFNTMENTSSSNWLTQGADAGLYKNSEIFAVRILAMEPSSHLSYGPDGEGYWKRFSSFASERLRILGEIPLRKGDGAANQPRDGDGNPDTSFLARIPADVPFTFQTIDKNGLVLNMSQTWHQLRPGERRSDCGGCHGHSNDPTDFAKTAAAQPNYVPWDLVDRLTLLTKTQDGSTQVSEFRGSDRQQRMDVEYLRDIKPILKRSCVGCHTSKNGATPPAQLDLDDSTIVDGYEKTFRCLTNDPDAKCGVKPVIGSWRIWNASRWVRKFQSRRSLLTWKVFGARLDGWTNADHPTESTPGDASTLPPGTNPSDADLDFTGTIMPPPGSGYQPLSEDEKMMFARWIDLGAPSDRNTHASTGGWFVDDLRPTLHVSAPNEIVVRSLPAIEFVAQDYYSGLKPRSFAVTTDFTIDGRKPGADIGSLFSQVGPGVWRYTLGNPIDALERGTITVRVSDVAGNVAESKVTFAVNQNGVPPRNPAPSSKKPYITSRSLVRARVGRRFRYAIKAANVGREFAPVKFIVRKLPAGFRMNAKHQIEGMFRKAGTQRFIVQVQNKHGISIRQVIQVQVVR